MTYQALAKQRLKELNSPTLILNALSAVLDRSFIKIIRFIKELGRGRTPWVHYELANGQRLATFISPKAFQGYWWSKDYSQTINRSTGAKYQVTNSYCSCPDWNNRVRAGKKKQCKHQAMRAEHIGINLSDSLPEVVKVEKVERLQPQRRRSKLYEVNPNILEDGFTLEKIQDSTDTKYYLKAWYKSDPSVAPILKTLGIITETERGFLVTGADEKSEATVPFQADCVGSLLRYNGIDYNKDILRAFQEVEAKQCPDCGTIDNTATKQINYCTLCGWTRKNTPAFRY